MSLQDDIFDVADALKNKPEAEAFDRIITHMNQSDHIRENQQNVLTALQQGVKALRWIEREMEE